MHMSYDLMHGMSKLSSTDLIEREILQFLPYNLRNY